MGDRPEKRKSRLVFGAVAVILAASAFAAVSTRSSETGGREPQPTVPIVIKDQGGFTSAISTVAEQLIPAVVHIDITGTVEQQAPQFFPFENDPFFRFFSPPPQQRKVPIRALGSGVIISKDGYIITNNHVVEHADRIDVELHDGTKRQAKLVGADPSTDLAVVKIDPTPGMRYARLGDSDQVKVGEWVIAIGSPRGFDWTVTAGIVSAKHRTSIGALGPAGYEDFIQTDASINPGNSGGPLINLNGEVIGINSLIISASQGSEGMGFAIPSNMAREISRSLIEEGMVVRGYLGVNIQDITPDMAKSLKLKSTAGVIVAQVMPGGPADTAGMTQGDIVRQYDGKDIENVSQLRNLVAATQPGFSVQVKVLRDGREKHLTVKIGDLVKNQAEARSQGGGGLLGVSVQKVTPRIAKELGLSKAEGVVITGVASGSPAERAGLQKDDVVFRVDNFPVNDPKEFARRISLAAERGGALLLIRDTASGRVGYITVPLKQR
jgi:serine protease Do